MSSKVNKKTSPLWAFFTLIDEHFASCNKCKKKISYKTSTSNLKKHLENKHSFMKIPALASSRTYGRFKKISPKVTNKTENNPLWTFFTAVDDHIANCNMCNQKLSFKTSTSNLIKHLKRKHPTAKIPTVSTRINKRSNKVPPKLSNKPKTSPLWAFFTEVDTHFANCNICKQEFSYKTSTTNLKKHLQNKHPKVDIHDPSSARLYESSSAQDTDTEMESKNEEHQPSIRSCRLSTNSQPQTPRTIKMEQQQLVQTFDTSLPSKVSGKSNDTIDGKLLHLFIQDFQPFSMVQDLGFQEFVSALNPAYQLPSKHIISKTLIPAVYEQCRAKTKALLDTGKSFCVTTDSWTSINEVSYNAITAHFLDDNFKLISLLLECSATDACHTWNSLASELQRVTTEWGIKNKTISAVSDDANIVHATESIAGLKHMGCVAQTINLTVEDGLNNENIETTINKVEEIAMHFRKDNTAHDELMKCQENLGRTLPLKLILEVSTSWNSTFYMLQRFIELEEAVKSTLDVIEQELPILTAEEWNTIKELCQVLRPFEDATKTISGEKYCSASLVIPICNGIKKTLLKLAKKQFSEPIKQVLEVLQSNVEERLGNVENSDILSVSTFLDPKFKQMAFSNDSTANTVKQKIINMLSEKITIKSQEQQMQVETSNIEIEFEVGVDEEDTSIWSDFDRSVANQPKGITSRAIIEMQLYMEEDIIPRHSDTFIWWQQHKQLLPHLSEVAQDRLCALASPIPCDRLFPEAGQLLTERRNRLKDGTPEMLLFLNANQAYFS